MEWSLQWGWGKSQGSQQEPTQPCLMLREEGRTAGKGWWVAATESGLWTPMWRRWKGYLREAQDWIAGKARLEGIRPKGEGRHQHGCRGGS